MHYNHLNVFEILAAVFAPKYVLRSPEWVRGFCFWCLFCYPCWWLKGFWYVLFFFFLYTSALKFFLAHWYGTAGSKWDVCLIICLRDEPSSLPVCFLKLFCSWVVSWVLLCSNHFIYSLVSSLRSQRLILTTGWIYRNLSSITSVRLFKAHLRILFLFSTNDWLLPHCNIYLNGFCCFCCFKLRRNLRKKDR